MGVSNIGICSIFYIEVFTTLSWGGGQAFALVTNLSAKISFHFISVYLEKYPRMKTQERIKKKKKYTSFHRGPRTSLINRNIMRIDCT